MNKRERKAFLLNELAQLNVEFDEASGLAFMLIIGTVVSLIVFFPYVFAGLCIFIFLFVTYLFIN